MTTKWDNNSCSCAISSKCMTEIDCYNDSVLQFHTPHVKIADDLLTTPTTRLETIEEQMMIENWKPMLSYVNYFKSCASSVYTYTCSAKYHWIFVVTTLLGLLGGLRVVLNILVFVVIKWIRSKRRQSQQSLTNIQQSCLDAH
ncbi:unnamed protein product, partial [Rotaria sp. Silwood2]